LKNKGEGNRISQSQSLEACEFVLVGAFLFGLGFLEVQRATRYIEILRLVLAGE
jgi:hypothetical protein